MNRLSDEADKITEILATEFPPVLDGKKCVKALKRAGSGHEHQMEWQAFYFEYMGRESLSEQIGGGEGPMYENTTFDYSRRFIWDFKVHSTNKDWAIANDKEAIDVCLDAGRGIGFIIAHGEPVYEETQEFREWHQKFKGGKSDYTERREDRGSQPRRRKKEFILQKISTVFLDSEAALERGLREGWIRTRQQGRNSNGDPRGEKYHIKVDRVPPEATPAPPRNVDDCGSIREFVTLSDFIEDTDN